MSFINKVKEILYIDSFVSKHKAKDQQRNQLGIAIIAAVVFAVMSLLNAKEQSYIMLASTLGSAVLLMVGYFISKYKNKPLFLKLVFYTIFWVVFTSYTLQGGNDGFAVLWMVTATYAMMISIDFKAGCIISIYYLIMLILVFIGPLKCILGYDYNKTFMLRFPFFYAANFAFAVFIVICVRRYQYDFLIKQQELERLSTIDLSTGLLNRNYFIQYIQSFSFDNLKSLSGVYIDVNGLHEINNRKGHAAGDRMLYVVANLCKKQFEGSSVFRMGGDEFLILCENMEEERVEILAKTLSDSVEKEGYSISYGIERQESDFDLDRLVKRADDKMIKSKKRYYEQSSRQKR